MAITLILIKYSLMLAACYAILFLIDRSIIRRNTRFLPITIPLVMILIIWLAIRDLDAVDGPNFWGLMAYGLIISLLAELTLQIYKLLIKLTPLNIKRMLPTWYRNMAIKKCVAETVVYGILTALPVAIHFSFNHPVLTSGAFLLVVVLLFTKTEFAGFARKQGWWFK